MTERDIGQEITDEINANPVEAERLRRSRQQAREGHIQWVDGNERIDKLLKDKPHLAEKVRQLRAKWLVEDYEAEHGEITDTEIAEVEGRKH